MTLIELVSLKLAIGTLLAQVFIVVAVLYLLFFKKKYIFLENFLAKYGILFAFMAALSATLSSLFYSEIAGYDPCVLCWYQRIFMYPQVIILGMAFWKKDRGIVNYSLVLSITGALIATYHYLMQIGVVSSTSCGVVGYSVSCVKLFVMQFGYITIPLMSLTVFLLMITFLVFVKMKTRAS